MSRIERLGVIGDVHAEDERLEITLGYLQQQEVDVIVCTGDIVDGPGCPNRVVEMLQSHEVRCVRGNHDRWILQNRVRNVPGAHSLQQLTSVTIDYLNRLPLQIELETIAGDLLLCHGIGDNDLKKIWPGSDRLPMERSQELDRIIGSNRFRFLVNGHMHFRTIIHFDGLTLINAGTLKNTHRPGFSIMDFHDFEVTAFEFRGNSVVLSKSLPLAAECNQEVWRNTAEFTGSWTPLILYGDLEWQE